MEKSRVNLKFRILAEPSQQWTQLNLKPPSKLACCLEAMSLVCREVLGYLLRKRLSRKLIAASKGAKRLSRVVRSATGRPSCTTPVQSLLQSPLTMSQSHWRYDV